MPPVFDPRTCPEGIITRFLLGSKGRIRARKNPPFFRTSGKTSPPRIQPVQSPKPAEGKRSLWDPKWDGHYTLGLRQGISGPRRRSRSQAKSRGKGVPGAPRKARIRSSAPWIRPAPKRAISGPLIEERQPPFSGGKLDMASDCSAGGRGALYERFSAWCIPVVAVPECARIRTMKGKKPRWKGRSPCAQNVVH